MTCVPAPMANSISVAVGDSETIFCGVSAARRALAFATAGAERPGRSTPEEAALAAPTDGDGMSPATATPSTTARMVERRRCNDDLLSVEEPKSADRGAAGRTALSSRACVFVTGRR